MVWQYGVRIADIMMNLAVFVVMPIVIGVRIFHPNIIAVNIVIAKGEQKMNKVVLIGRLTHDVEVRYSQSAEPVAIASFSVAVDRGYKKDGQVTADFINCVAFGATGDNIGKYFFKGNKIALTGRIQVDSYKDKEGKSQVSTKVVVDGFEFCESKREPDSSNSNAQTLQSYSQTETFFTASQEADENDLPF